MLGIEATPSDKQGTEPTQQSSTCPPVGLLVDSLEQVFPQGEGSLLGGLGPPPCRLKGCPRLQLPAGGARHREET